MTKDLAHLQLSDLRGEIIYAERRIYNKKECLYAERNRYFPYWNDLKEIVLMSSICIFYSYLLIVCASLIKMCK